MIGNRMVMAGIAVCASLTACTTSTAGSGSAPITGTTPTPVPGSATVTITATPTAATSASTPATFSQLYARQKSGVVRIETVGCADAGLGTGFLLSSGLVATVAHVVNESVVVSLIVGRQRTTGTVIGIDRDHDLALVRPAQTLTGRAFRFRPNPPAVGDPVAAIGFPYGDPITLTQGHISGLGRRVPVDGTLRSGLIETDTAINPGNSGGPLIDADGGVDGLIDAGTTNANGIGYAVAATTAATEMNSWSANPQPQAPATCANPLGPSQGRADVPTPGQLDERTAAGISAAFNTYFGGINNGDYATAFGVLSPRLRNGTTLQSFADGDATSYDTDISVLAARRIDATTVKIALQFTSLQRADKGPAGGGDTCDVWTLDYTMIQASDSSWLIDGDTPYRGSGHTAC